MPTSSRRSDSGPRRLRAAAQRADEPRAPSPAGHAVCEHLLPLLQRLVHAHGLRLVERADGLGSGLGFLFDPQEGLDGIASIIESHAKDPDLYAALRRRVAARALVPGTTQLRRMHESGIKTTL